jgi:hypothetical protein
VAVQVPLAGPYRSTLGAPPSPRLPATRTVPSCSNVAVWSTRGVLRLPVVVQVPLAGSYSSALAKKSSLGLSTPPTTSTLPFWSSVAV